MQSQSVGYALSVTNVSITGSYLVTTICSEQLMNSSLTTIVGGLIEVLVRERHVRMLGKYRENRPSISYRNRSSAGCIMCTNGLLKITYGVFAPCKGFKRLIRYAAPIVSSSIFSAASVSSSIARSAPLPLKDGPVHFIGLALVKCHFMTSLRSSLRCVIVTVLSPS